MRAWMPEYRIRAQVPHSGYRWRMWRKVEAPAGVPRSHQMSKDAMPATVPQTRWASADRAHGGDSSNLE